MINKEKLYKKIEFFIKDILSEFGFYKPDFGGGYEKKEVDIYNIGHSQIVTQGIMDNKFEISFGGNCTIMKVEDLWHDLYPLTIQMPDEKHYTKEYIEKFKKLYPATYSVQYDKEKIRDVFPENIRDTGWLCFDISDKGFEQFKKVLRYIISELLIPELEKFHSIELLDKMINSKIEITENDKHIVNSFQGFIFRRIIIAKFNNNPLFEEICDYTRSYFPQILELSKRPGKEYFKNYPFVFEEVYKRLKNIS